MKTMESVERGTPLILGRSQQAGYLQAFRKSMNNAVTLGKIFKMAGYTTMRSGKHHSAELPTTRCFDHYSGLFEGASNHFNPGKRREGEGQAAQKRPASSS